MLQVLDSWDIVKFSAEFQEVNDHVNAEYKLEESLDTIAEQWDGYAFQIRALAQVPYAAPALVGITVWEN